MIKRVLILAASAKKHGLCVAGLDLDCNRFIRLVSNNKSTDGAIPIFYENFIHVGDELNVKILRKSEDKFQPENYMMSISTNPMDSVHLLRHHDNNSIIEYMKPYIYDENYIFKNIERSLDIHKMQEQTSSIIWVKVTELSIYLKQSIDQEGNMKHKIKARFYYNHFYYIDISLTDRNFKLHNLEKMPTQRIDIGDAYLLMTLPHTPFGSRNLYYKFVAAVFSSMAK